MEETRALPVITFLTVGSSNVKKKNVRAFTINSSIETVNEIFWIAPVNRTDRTRRNRERNETRSSYFHAYATDPSIGSKKHRSSILRWYLIESGLCGRVSNQSWLSSNEIVMKSVSMLGICGDPMIGLVQWQILFRIFASRETLL